jgi:hypothetical protein
VFKTDLFGCSEEIHVQHRTLGTQGLTVSAIGYGSMGLTMLATAKGITVSQLALAWLLAQGEHIVPDPWHPERSPRGGKHPRGRRGPHRGRSRRDPRDFPDRRIRRPWTSESIGSPAA